jgi:hypothetical protein
MMRDVTVYEVTSHQACAGDFVEMYRMPPLDSVLNLGRGQVLMAEPELVQRLRLKVHTIRHVGRADEYLAIEPQLETLLMLPLKARLTEAEVRTERQTREATLLRQRLAAFNALPWYRRVWVAIRRAA